MASLPRTSFVCQSSSALSSHREQQTFEPTENEAFIPKEVAALPRLEGGITYPPARPKDYGARKALLPNDVRSESIASIVGCFVTGVALAISHHIFLAFLNGRNIDEYPQYWVKNANNAFSALFSLCIALVATCALTQMKWHVARSMPLSIMTIDNLFALPSPVALLTTVTLTRLRSLRLFLLPILAAIFIQSLAIVNVFAPNALTVARNAEISRDILVPTLDLSTGPITSATLDLIYQYVSASQLWSTFLTSILLQPPLLNWKIPPGCGATCKFDLVYDGPGLQCMDTPSEPSPYTPPYSGPLSNVTYPLFYNATSTLYPPPRNDPSSSWEIKEQYELRIGYLTTDNSSRLNVEHNGGSVHCVLRHATYKASFQVENHTMEVNHATQSYGDILGTVKYGPSDLQCSQNFTAPCLINGINMRAMCEVFASSFTGKMQLNQSQPPALTEITGGINEGVIDLLFSHDPDDVTKDFHLGVSNLSESLVYLFSNLTFGFIPYRNDTITVRAEIWDGSYAWLYTVWILWAVYFPTLLLASLVMLNGLLSIRSNKQGMDDKFSSLLLATRDTELDDVCMGAKDFAELQRFRLLYGREGTFSVASGGEYAK